jgi:hypothetical protein
VAPLRITETSQSYFVDVGDTDPLPLKLSRLPAVSGQAGHFRQLLPAGRGEGPEFLVSPGGDVQTRADEEGSWEALLPNTEVARRTIAGLRVAAEQVPRIPEHVPQTTYFEGTRLRPLGALGIDYVTLAREGAGFRLTFPWGGSEESIPLTERMKPPAALEGDPELRDRAEGLLRMVAPTRLPDVSSPAPAWAPAWSEGRRLGPMIDAGWVTLTIPTHFALPEEGARQWVGAFGKRYVAKIGQAADPATGLVGKVATVEVGPEHRVVQIRESLYRGYIMTLSQRSDVARLLPNGIVIIGQAEIDPLGNIMGAVSASEEETVIMAADALRAVLLGTPVRASP